uniref:Uncharacterized protein n=1 Tax=Physcomitrium patens TaxID=3218 RepID=A0A2K1IIK4_PHYPA|nr:hypothetical protein PHYPA_027796 [Physcomitrium patens]
MSKVSVLVTKGDSFGVHGTSDPPPYTTAGKSVHPFRKCEVPQVGRVVASVPLGMRL